MTLVMVWKLIMIKHCFIIREPQKQDYPSAIVNLAMMYDRGKGVETNYEIAANYLKKAAD